MADQTIPPPPPVAVAPSTITPVRTRTRSPAYPSISLREAIKNAQQIWAAQQKHPAHMDSVLSTIGYVNKTGPALRAIAALNQYGLTKETGSGDNRSIALSDLALDYILAPDEAHKVVALRKAALKPTIFAHLWTQYGQFPPPNDDTIQKHLIRDKNFNTAMVADLVSDYRDTFDFAKLADIVPGNDTAPSTAEVDGDKSAKLATEHPAPARRENPPVGRQGPPLRAPAPMSAIRYLPIPLDIGDAPIPVGMSEEDFTLLLDTLNLWKKRLVRSPEKRDLPNVPFDE